MTILLNNFNYLKQKFFNWFNMALKPVIFLLFFFLSGVCISQTENKVWSLEECINYALDNNIQIKQQLLNIDLNEKELLQNKLNMLPSLNAYASHGYNWGQRVDLYTNTFATDRVRSNNFYIQSTFSLFNGFQKLNTLKQNQLNLLATKYDTDKFMDDISISIATYYLQTLFYMEYIEITKSQLDITNQQVERTKKLVEAGTLARGDLLTIEAQQATEELSVIEAENQLTLSYLTLAQLLDFPSAEGFEIEKPDFQIPDTKPILTGPNEIYKHALITQPDIKSAETKVESSEKGLNIVKGSQSPDLYVSGSWGTGYSGADKLGIDPVTDYPQIGVTQNGEAVYSISEYTVYDRYETKNFSDQLNDNRNHTVTLNLSIPIFNGWQTRTAISKAKISIESAQYDLKNTKLNLYKTIQQAYTDAKAALNKHAASVKKVEATQEAFKYSQQKFDVGLLNSVDYNETKKEMSNAQSELLQNKYDFIFKSTVLNIYMGKPLTLKK